MRPAEDTVIDPGLMTTLGYIASINHRSLEEELNLAVRAYIDEQIPAHGGAMSPESTFAPAGRREDCVG
jgi:hypothetical protein